MFRFGSLAHFQVNDDIFRDWSRPADSLTAGAKSAELVIFLCVSAFSAVKSRRFAVAILHHPHFRGLSVTDVLQYNARDSFIEEKNACLPKTTISAI
jgi:hypothetical protein